MFIKRRIKGKALTAITSLKTLSVLLAFFTALTISAQSGGWDLQGQTGTPSGYTDHGNGVIQLLGTDATGCSAAAIHENTDTYDPTVDGVFNKCYEVYFGCPGDDQIGSDTKGDGLAFSFSKCGFTIGDCGGGLGYGNVGGGSCAQMMTIEFDTWSSQGADNFDNAYEGTGNNDQIAIHRNGDAAFTGKVVGFDAGNLEDGLEHNVCISYDPATGIMAVELDGNSLMNYTMPAADRLETYFGAGGLTQTWSSGKNGATNPATVTDGADISDNVGSNALCLSEVIVTSPLEGQIFGSCEEAITVTASAIPPAGNTVDYVEFFVDGQSIGTDATDGYSAVWNNPDFGASDITAVAHFLPSGTSTTSEALEVIVGNGIEIVKTAPVIDGTAEAVWSNYPAIPLNKAEAGVSAPDLDATYKIAYDADNLYVLVDVTDDVLRFDGGNRWEDDGVEIYIERGNGKSGSYDGDDFQFTFLYSDAPNVGGINTTGIVYGESTTANGYLVEVSIPWTTIGTTVPEEGDFLGFDISVNDDDAGNRESRLAWNDGSYNSWQNPSLFGTQKFTGCTAVDAFITANAGPAEFCAGDSIMLSANPQDASYLYEWLLEDVSISATQLADSVLWVKAGGNYKVIVDNGAVPDTSDVFVVSVNSLPLADAGANDAFCSGTGGVALNATGGTTYAWTPTTGLSNAAIANPIAEPTSTTTFTVTVGDGTCSDTSAVTVTVNETPTTGAITSIADICEGEDIELELTGQTAGATIEWLVSADDVTYENASLGSSATETVSGLTAGDYFYKALISTTTCADTTELSVDFTVNVMPLSGAITAVSDICEGEDVELELTGQTAGATIEWLVSADGVTYANAGLGSSATETVSGLTAGDYFYKALVSTTTCADTTELAVDFTVNATPLSGAITAVSDICEGEDVELELTGQTAGTTIEWLVSADGVTYANAGLGSSATETVSGLTAGDYFYKALVSKTTCADTTALSVDFKVNPELVISAYGINPTSCGATDGQIVIKDLVDGVSYQVGYNGDPAVGMVAAGDSVIISGLNSATYANIIVENTASCTDEVNSVTLSDPGSPSIEAGNDTIVCEGVEITLAAVNPDGATITWDNGAVDGVAFAVTTTTTFGVRAELAGCVSNDSRTVTVNATPDVTSTSDITICEGESVQLEGSGAATYSWESGTITDGDFVTPTTTTNYGVEGTDSKGCTDSSYTLVTVNPTPVSGTITPISDFCADGSALLELTGHTSSGTTIEWLVSNNGTDFSAGASTTLNGLDASTYHYKAVVSIGSCADTTEVESFVVNANPTAYAGEDDEFCEGTGGVTLTATGGISYSWSPTTGLSDATSATTTADPATPTKYFVTVSDGTCSSIDSVTVGIIIPSVASAGDDVSICTNEEGTTLTATGGNTYMWSPSAGLSDSTISNPVAKPSVTTTYTVTVGQGVCADVDEVVVTVNEAPVANAGIDIVQCSDSGAVELSGSGVGTFSWSPASSLDNSTIANPLADPLVTTIYTLTVDNGLCTATDDVTLILEKCKSITITDVITPNGDGKNDEWVLPGIGSYDSHQVVIFNRWGNEIFNSENYTVEMWDGTRNGEKLPYGTYYYIITLEGESTQGNITIIR